MDELNDRLCNKLMISKYSELMSISKVDSEIRVFFKDVEVGYITKDGSLYIFTNYTEPCDVKVVRPNCREMCSFILGFYRDLINQYKFRIPWYITKRRCKIYGWQNTKRVRRISGRLFMS